MPETCRRVVEDGRYVYSWPIHVLGSSQVANARLCGDKPSATSIQQRVC